MATHENQPEQPWDDPLKRIREIEERGLRNALEAIENSVGELQAFERQWTHTQLPDLMRAWPQMDFERKRQSIDTFVEFAERFKAETRVLPDRCGAKVLTQMIEMLGDMTPDHREHACEAAARVTDRKQSVHPAMTALWQTSLKRETASRSPLGQNRRSGRAPRQHPCKRSPRCRSRPPPSLRAAR